MLKEVAAILLITFVCVRSHWLLSQPCDQNGNVAPYGTYVNGDCDKDFGYSTYSVCDKGQSWLTFTCGDQSDCTDNSCQMTQMLQMGQCTNGYHYSCTSKDIDLNNLGWPAVEFGMYSSGCAIGPVEAYVAQQNVCINYRPENSNYQSYTVGCMKNGAQAKISFYQQANCANLAKTVVMGTNNCTTAPDFFFYTAIQVQCSN